MRELKDVTTNTNNLKEKTLDKFCLLIKKAARTRQSQTCLQYISRLVKFIEDTPIFDNLRFKFTKEKEAGEDRLHCLRLQVYNGFGIVCKIPSNRANWLYMTLPIDQFKR